MWWERHRSKIWTEAKRLMTHWHHLLSPEVLTRMRWRNHTCLGDTMWTVNHAASDGLLLLVVGLLLWALCNFGHLLKV
jgi:hypothetical protein